MAQDDKPSRHSPAFHAALRMVEQAAPATVTVVPTKPSVTMLRAGALAGRINVLTTRAIYRAMLRAAQSS